MVQTRRYWNTIDFIKGLLIIFVFWGHLIIGEQRTTFLRYIIYSFHMPIFIGVSGFLFNIRKKPKEMINYYGNRIIIPWCIAVGGYYFVNVILGVERVSIKEIIHNFIFPYYHLWFVLGLLSYILLTYILCNMMKISEGWYKEKTNLFIVILAIAVSIASQWDLLAGLKDTWLGGIYTFFRVLQLNKFAFFVLGFYLRQCYENRGYIVGDKIKKLLIVFLVLNIIALVVLFPCKYTLMEKVLWFTLNIPLLLLVLHYGLMEHKFRCKVIEWIGVY